jgi:hypothetical protein
MMDRLPKIYRNELGKFVDILANIKYVRDGSVEWGDYDNDGDLDFILSGLNYFIGPITFIYQNQIASQSFQDKLSTPNNKPASPTNLQTMVDGTDLIFSWDKATDYETEQDALTYNIRVGTTLDGNELMPSMSKPQTGYRFKPELGNVNHNTIWRLKNVPNSIIFWTFQAIDNAYAGSEFAPVQQIITGVRSDTFSIINNYSLSQNYPNPFNPTTMINYQLTMTSVVELSIYNFLGQKVVTLVNERKRAGYHNVEWDASHMASGVYLYRLEAEGFIQIKKMVLMR